MKCQEVEPVPRRGSARRPMRSLLAVQFPELGQVWTRLFGQALMIGRAQLVEGNDVIWIPETRTGVDTTTRLCLLPEILI